jgi:pyruvate/2-oxoglutarate dehydrogenase complex dihydrolipoamide dehydrogenase (E3) component
MDFDVVIIGGGSAGYAAARTAREANAKVAIVDHGPLGGLCILKGCMPTKTILRSSDLMALQRRAQEFGLLPVQAKADLSAINDRKNRIIGEFTKYRVEQLQNPGFTLFQDAARFLSPNEVQVGDQTLRAKNFIIATGSKISEFPVPGLKEAGVLTSDDVLEMREAPQSLIVLGAGPVAVELAQFFSRIGVKVSLIQRSHQILSGGDEDLARVVEARMREEGMDVYTSTKLLDVTKEGNDRVLRFLHESHEKTVRAQHILQALGRRPNTDGLDLESAKVETHMGRIVVNSEMRTNQQNIFAVGDVNGLHEIVHIAIEQGEIAAHNAVFPDKPARKMDDRLKTSVVFTDPAVASVGLSEKECQAEGIAYLMASYPFNDHGKSICMGETHGHVKILCHPKTGEILGAHIVGPEAGELIHELIAVMYFNGTVHDLVKIPHYHPTLSEIITYPAEDLIEKLT